MVLGERGVKIESDLDGLSLGLEVVEGPARAGYGGRRTWTHQVRWAPFLDETLHGLLATLTLLIRSREWSLQEDALGLTPVGAKPWRQVQGPHPGSSDLRFHPTKHRMTWQPGSRISARKTYHKTLLTSMGFVGGIFFLILDQQKKNIAGSQVYKTGNIR